MNYEKIYHLIINNRIQNPVIDEYTECHHILPKSLGGNDDENNLVNLLAREHFICHLLLTKMFKKDSSEWIKMMKAFMRMYSFNNYQKRYSDNKWYNYLRNNFSRTQSLSQTGKGNSQFGKCWVSNIILKECKSINKNDLQKYIDEGWIKKRIINWDSYVYVNNKPVYKTNKRMKQFNNWKTHTEKLKKYYNKLYDIYDKYGIQGVYKYTDYKYSRQNLVQQMSKYVDRFINKK